MGATQPATIEKRGDPMTVSKTAFRRGYEGLLGHPGSSDKPYHPADEGDMRLDVDRVSSCSPLWVFCAFDDAGVRPKANKSKLRRRHLYITSAGSPLSPRCLGHAHQIHRLIICSAVFPSSPDSFLFRPLPSAFWSYCRGSAMDLAVPW